MKNNSVGKNIASLRKQKKLSLRELEEITQVSSRYISTLECGKHSNPSAAILNKLATAFNTTIENLLNSTANDEDAVFFRTFRTLDPQTKKIIMKMVNALKEDK